MNFNPLTWLKKSAPPDEDAKADGQLMDDVSWSQSTIYSGKDFPQYNPDELMGRKGAKIYQRMMSDEQVKAVVRFKRDAITSRSYQFLMEEACGLSETEMELRKEVYEHAVGKMEGSFADALNCIMSAMYMGFSITEKVFQLNDMYGKSWYGIKHLRLKPAESFLFFIDEFGNLIRFAQRMYGQEQDVDIEKFIHYVQNPEWDPHYGRSELRECYRAWFSKDMIIKFQNIHLERFAGGFIWARPTNGKQLNPQSQEYQNLQAVLTNIHTKTSMIVPENVDINVEVPSTTDQYERTIAQHDKSIAKSLLVPNLLGVSEQGQHGSLAQADSQLEAFLWTLEADTARLEDCLNEQLFEDIGELNFGDGVYPRFKFNPISNKTKMSLVSTWGELVGKGAVEPSDTDEEHLRELLEFPDKGEPLKKAPAPGAIDPVTGLPVAAPKVGLPSESPPGSTPAPKLPTEGSPTPIEEACKPKAKLQEETVCGTQSVTVTAFSRALKRVDFTVIAHQSDDTAHTTSYDIASANSDAVARMVENLDGVTMADVKNFKYTADELGKLKSTVATGLKESWKIGVDHARRELSKASKQVKFDVADLTLNELATEWIKARAFTITGNISGATQATIQGIIMEGVKNSKSPAEMKTAIYKQLEADGMLTDEAVQEALGTTTVKDTKARIQTIVRTTSFEAINEARYKVFADPALDGFVEALEYSAIMDDRTTDVCSALNGNVYPVNDEAWATFSPPNHYNAIASGSIVETIDGGKRIEDVLIGDRVLTHRGNFKRVYSVMAKIPDTSFLKVVTLDTGDILLATDEHPVLTKFGWDAVRNLNIGDVLFKHVEDISGIESGLVAHPENSPSLFDEEHVTFDVGFRSDARGMSFTVDLKNDHAFDEREIGHVAFDRMLAFKLHAAHAESFGHQGLVPSEVVLPGSSPSDGGGNCYTVLAHRVGSCHPIGMGSMNVAGLLAQSEGPMIGTSGFAGGVGIGNLALVDSTSNGDTVSLAPIGESGLSDSDASLNRANGFFVPKVAFGNEVEDYGSVAKVEHKDSGGWVGASIVSIAEVAYNYPVWNLGVEDDESYHANGIIVHNCRSLLIPVTQRDTWQASDPPTVNPQKGFGFERLAKPEHRHG